jgi:hypothetical protein
LTREHRFVRALFAEARKRLWPLVEEERKREEGQEARVESAHTRKRLSALEKAATEFLHENEDAEEHAREPDGKANASSFKGRGYYLSPPFLQLVVGHSAKCWLNVHQPTLPEIELGATVQVECLSDEIEVDRKFCCLEKHPVLDGIMRAIWTVKANRATSATGVRATVGRISDESIVEVFESEADRYKHVHSLAFGKKTFAVRTDAGKKKIRLFAPLSLVARPCEFVLQVSSKHFSVTGELVLKPDTRLGIAMCEFGVKGDGTEDRAELVAICKEQRAVAELKSVAPLGEKLQIKVRDVDHGNQRYMWRSNVIEIAARHPSLRRYLGVAPEFAGQEHEHFRVLLAEIVADAVCQRLVSSNVRANPEEWEGADWDQFYSEYSQLMTKFLPIAHQSQCPD